MLDLIISEFKTMLHIGKFIAHAYANYRKNIAGENIPIEQYRRHSPAKKHQTKRVHHFGSIGTQLRCVTCLTKHSSSNERQTCSYDVHQLGHSIWSTPPFVFCVRCGSYSSDRIDALSRTCPGSTTTLHFSRAKSRLLKGHHPVTDKFISTPYPISKIVFNLSVCHDDLSELFGDYELDVIGTPETAPSLEEDL